MVSDWARLPEDWRSTIPTILLCVDLTSLKSNAALGWSKKKDVGSLLTVFRDVFNSTEMPLVSCT